MIVRAPKAETVDIRELAARPQVNHFSGVSAYQEDLTRILGLLQINAAISSIKVQDNLRSHRVEDHSAQAAMAGNSLPALEIPMSGANRTSPSPTTSIASAQGNGANAANYASPYLPVISRTSTTSTPKSKS